MSNRYPSYDGRFEAVLPECDIQRNRQINRLLATSETDLNIHLMLKHLPQPGLMSSQGFQYDAELACFLGLKLDQVGEEATHVIHGLQNDDFANTHTYRKMIEYMQPYEKEADLYWKIVEFGYLARVAAELAAIVELGLVSGHAISNDDLSVVTSSNVQPIDHDSFFVRFNVVPV